MSKISISFLLLAAFIYAAFLLVFKRKLPDSRLKTGLERRFILAVILMAGMMMTAGCRDKTTLCYAPAYRNAETEKLNPSTVTATLRAAWKVLDAEKGEEFRKKLEECVKNRDMSEDVSKMLALAYSDLSNHRMMTRVKDNMVTCYKPTVLGSKLYESNETALKQIELLRAARAKGTIDDETARKVSETLSKELQLLSDAAEVSKLGFEEQKKFIEKSKDGGVVPGNAAKSAAKIIVELEKE
ncbi:MAG TPA: hypothetical protein DET40_06000 [Lentisphaeria bacterium]|nr:MAG: hypothetical protein A2X45_04505 [Lentisphaerae bacterium GWF2_50_93]HCE43080.1 hypothetical protein [Lentisphaeria bacterium]